MFKIDSRDQLQMGHSPGYKAMMTESYMDMRLINRVLEG
jgi:hypothetical protein